MRTLDFILNGEACHTEIPEDATLLKVLRDILHLTGTKEPLIMWHLQEFLYDRLLRLK